MKDNTYVVIQSFMLSELGLKGNELIVYAVIYGYTQDGEHWFYGTRGHLAEWCGATKGTVSNCLASLVERGLVERREVERHGRVEVHYRAVSEFATPLPKIGTPPTKNYDTPLSKIDSIDSKEDTSSRKPSNKGFKPPKPEDVAAYMNGRNTPIDAEAFCDYWESVGWMRGKAKMKDWKAAARQWARNDAKWSKQKGVNWDAELRELADALDF